MRWRKVEKEKEVGKIRYRFKFLWFPVTIGDETRWLEFAYVKEELMELSNYSVQSFGMDHNIYYNWVPTAFVMTDPVKECQLYKSNGCSFVDGLHCNPKYCDEYELFKQPLGKRVIKRPLWYEKPNVSYYTSNKLMDEAFKEALKGRHPIYMKKCNRDGSEIETTKNK